MDTTDREALRRAQRRQEAVDGLVTVADDLETDELGKSDYDHLRPDWAPTAAQITHLFGTWTAGVGAAGLRPARPGLRDGIYRGPRRRREDGQPANVYSNSDMIAHVREVYESVEAPYMSPDMYNENRIPGRHAAASTIMGRLGPWPQVQRLAGVASFQDTCRTDERVFRDMRKVAARLGVTTLSRHAYDKGRSPSMLTSAAIRLRYGSWGRACRLAGLGIGRSGRPGRFTNDDVAHMIWEVAVRLGKPDLNTTEYEQERDKPGMAAIATILVRFDTWEEAKTRAGIGPAAEPGWQTRPPASATGDR